ncbi:MAG: DUF2933 domain-containing protein [Thermomicrobiales bacterium]
MCLNWKVLAGLAIVGLGVWAVAPNLVGAAVPLLLIAACPLSMLLMMRGMGGMSGDQPPTQPVQSNEPIPAGGTREEQLAQLKARHAAIAREIAQMEAADGPVVERDMAAGQRPRTSLN